jgi:hypothetical protein
LSLYLLFDDSSVPNLAGHPTPLRGSANNPRKPRLPSGRHHRFSRTRNGVAPGVPSWRTRCGPKPTTVKGSRCTSSPRTSVRAPLLQVITGWLKWRHKSMPPLTARTPHKRLCPPLEDDVGGRLYRLLLCPRKGGCTVFLGRLEWRLCRHIFFFLRARLPVFEFLS